ncbi:MAG: hypothetical protein DME06_10475 [Candidatus Rokuibacteriota bacterium]|nr:MAG: hypothetical protein DME09_00810 [Candidatus Rokubacteria bacterium]PYN11966.1 MAG: hypothetical protein DME06_10475 [Candidatus Rokubacteria bacterium]
MGRPGRASSGPSGPRPLVSTSGCGRLPGRVDSHNSAARRRVTALPRTRRPVEGRVTSRAARQVRSFLGERLRALRKQRGLSQERLGHRSDLSGKFIGEVERGEKSISIDSLYRVAVALDVPLATLTDVRLDGERSVNDREAEKIFALVTARRRPEEIRKAYDVLRALFGKAS